MPQNWPASVPAPRNANLAAAIYDAILSKAPDADIIDAARFAVRASSVGKCDHVTH